MAKFGVYQHGIGWGYPQLREFVVEAERLGFDAAYMMDNNVMPDARQSDKMLPVFEAWTVLPALADATSKIRLGPMVTPCRRRHPALLAKITSTFDIISNGRLDLGLGAGEDPIYWLPWGMTLPKASVRIEMLREEVEVLKRMWTEKEADFGGKYYTLTKATCDPKPVQKPHPPIWIGLVLGRVLMPRLAADVADGISVYNASDVASRELLGKVEQRCKEIGRDFGTIPISRDIYIMMTDNEIDPRRRLSEFVSDSGSLPPVVGTLEELARERVASLDEQHHRMKVTTQDKHWEYSRVTERISVGTPDQIAEDLTDLAKSGYDHLVVHGLDTLDDLHKFSTQVMPRVK